MLGASFRIIPYFISQYLIYLIILIVFLVPNQFASKHVADERFCSSLNKENWSDYYDPDYFFHLTDVHVDHYYQFTLENFEKSLQVGISYKPKSILITGDLVNNFYLPYFPGKLRESRQNEEDWIAYSNIASKYFQYFDKYIESFGNHDVPRVLTQESDNFYYKKYSMISKSLHNFTTKNNVYDVFTEKIGNFTFTVLNPIFFPIPPLPFNYYVHAPTEFMDHVEQIIDSLPIDENIILATHYQGPTWGRYYTPFAKETATKRFFNSILQDKKVKILITGHNHGENRMIMHHGDSFEICASDLRYNSKAGIVTNDNGNVVYHWFSIYNQTQSFVTFPVPIDQTTSRTNCGVEKVRVISFKYQEDVNKMYVEIDGLKVKLNPIRKIENNKDVWLLEADLKPLSNGVHHLKLIGENEEEFEFLSGQSSKIDSKIELLYDDMLWAHTQWIGLIILFIIFTFATFPVNCLTFDDYWKWTNKMDDIKLDSQKVNNFKYWLVSIFLGPIGIRSRLVRLPLFIRIILFISVVYSLFVPLFIFEVEGHYGVMFPFGYFLGVGKGVDSSKSGLYQSHVYGKFELRYEEWCPFIAFLFFACAIVPAITAASSLGLMPGNRKESWIQLFDFMTLVGGLIGGLRLSFHSFMMLCERKCAILSPFAVVPFLWIVFFSVIFYLKRNRRVAKIN